MSDFEARNISRGPFTVAELEEVVAKGHGIVLDSADVPAILRAMKIVSAIETEVARLEEVRQTFADKIVSAETNDSLQSVKDRLHRTLDWASDLQTTLEYWLGKGDPVE